MGTLIQLFLLALAGELASSVSQDLLQPAILVGADGSQCSSECTNGIASGGDVGFIENMKYWYLFNGKTTIIAPSDSEDGTSEISISGVITIIGKQKCGALLYLKNVKITQGSNVYGNTELEGYPILFSYNNGKVGQNICTLSQDSTASLNLKRAITSAFQVSSIQRERRTNIFETDIQGTCNTTYYSSVSGTSRMVIKDKDLTQCTKQEKINLFGSLLESNPVYQDSPFSTATQSSEIKISDSTVKSVSNTETFVYQPFGPIDIPTKIIASMNIELKKMSLASAPSMNPLDKSRSIVFEKSISTVMSTNADSLVAATQSAMYNLEPVVDVDGATNFADLIALLKVANKDDILSAYQQIKSGTGFDDAKSAEEVFINALTAANSGASIGAVAELIDSQALSDELAVSWFKNLANAQHPTKEAVVSASSLLGDKALKEGYMGVGTLLRQYLKDTHDFDSPEVADTFNNLGAPLKKMFARSLSPEDEELAIASLKGLGNAQYLNSDILDLTLKIIMDKTVSPRIRAAAFGMIQSYAKNPMVEKASESIFKDISEDSELRILAFKVFSMNPSNYKATVIQNVLDDKNCQLQIQAFLLSYLRNIQTTVDENKYDQKRFYEGIKSKSPKKMLSDILRYSQSLEFSHKCPLLRSGVLFDGEVIYSQKSYIARSSSASLKTLLFGRQLHIFDFDVRVENIEPMLGKLFGPEGYFAKNQGSTIDDVKNYVTQAINYANSRRLNNVNSEPKSLQNYDNNSEEEVDKLYIDIALKVLGNDVGWLSFQGFDNDVTYKQIIDAIFKQFDDSIPDKKNLELSVKKQIPIIDYEKKYATSSGLPISMKIQATSAIKLNMTSTFDLDSYLKNPGNSNFAFKFLPSGSLNLNTLFTVDGSSVEVGYKVASLLHTSTGSDFSFKTIKGRGFQIVYGLPLDEMDVLSLQSRAFGTVQEKGSSLSETPLIAPNVERKTYTKTLENLNNMGLSYEVQYEYPWNGDFKSLLPLSGPLSLSLKIFKVDEKLTKYVVKGNYDFTSPTLKYVKLLFFTPKTDISRALEFMVAYDTKTDDKFMAELKTPSNKIILQSTLINSDKQNAIEVKYIDGSEHVLNMGVKYDQLDSETTKYSPIFGVTYSTTMNGDKIRHPHLPVFDIEGSFIVKRNVKSEISYPSGLTFKDIAVTTPNGKHSLQGALTCENNEINGNAILANDRVTINTHGFISGNYPIYKMSGALDMITNKQRRKRSLSDKSDEYEPTSKFVALLNKVDTLNITMFQELHVESPYVFLSNNRMLWDNDHFEMNSDILIQNNEVTMHGNISTSDLLDSVLNANLTVLPSTKDSSIFAQGLLQHYLVSDPSNIGYGDFKYVQNMDKRGSHFELNSDLPQTLGRFNLNAEHQSTDESFQSVLNYNIHDGTALKADMAIKTDDITLNMQFNSPNPNYNSYMNVRGWSENLNVYLFDTKALWPGSQDSNYLNADGKIILNGRDTQMSGNIDFPSANLVNVYVSVESEPDAEIEDGGIATVQFISNEQILLSEKFNYKLTQNNGEFYLSGESIDEDSQNLIPISFLLQIKNYADREQNNGKQVAYRFTMEHNGQTLLYQKFIQFTNHMVSYKQINQIDDDEQKISMDLEYNVKDAWNWSYRLKSKVISPSIFNYLVHDDQNLLECNSNIKFSGYTLDQGHTLKIVSTNGSVDLYELRWFLNNQKTAIKMLYGQREIRGLGHYSLKPIQGGYHLTYSGELWLDHNSDSNSECTLSIDTYYSLHDGLSTASDVNLYVPTFNDNDMGIKSDIQVFKSWENPFDVELELNIFPTTQQTLQVRSNLNRDDLGDGVMYSAEILAKSDGMKLDYAFKDSILVSNEKWGKYLDAYFIDSDNIKRPIQLHIELVPKGFTNKINIFDISVINVDSSIDIEDDALTINSIIGYNERLYSFELAMTSYPSFKYIMGWTGKSGNPEQLMVEGSITMDDSAVISATRIENNDKATPVGYITKSLEKPNWWETNNNMNTEQWNLVWKSLKGEFIERFINVHSNLKNIIVIEKSRRKVRAIEAKKASPQYHTLLNYTNEGWNQIFKELKQDDYLLEIPTLILNTTGAVFAEAKDLYENNLSKTLGRDIKTLSRNIYDYYSEQTDLFLNKMKRDYDELLEQINLTLLDMIKMLNEYIDKPLNDDSSTEPRSLRDYSNDLINKLIHTINLLKEKLDDIQDKSLDYIQSLPMYDMFHDQIEKLKSYPYKEKLWEEIHNYLHGLELSAPTKDFASFINTLDTYINNIIHDNPVSQKDITNLRNKGIIVAKSFIFSFSDYVNYDRAMSMYYTLNKLAELGNTMLYIVSPNSVQCPSDSQNMLVGVGDYIQLYRNYLNPSNLLPPYGVQGSIIASTNIITYNGQPYSFMPNTGSYVLAKDFINNKFSILGSYNDNTLTSISVSSGDNGEIFELQSGGKITVNGKNVDFPLIRDNVKTWKDVYFFGIDMSTGVSIKSTINLDIAEVFINGYYYGQVFGLLGSMYQEPTFDSKLPNGQPSSNMESFVLAYRQTGSTKPTIINKVETDQPLCFSLFSKTSTMKETCQSQTIEPTAYKAICNQVVSSATSQQDGLDKACLVAKAYVSMARENFLSNCNIPNMCITTKVQQRTFDATTQVQISTPNDVADVMVLFEEMADIEQPLSNLINTFVQQITTNFNKKGIMDVNVIVIGYSGKLTDSEVHIYTANGDNDYSRILSNVPEWSESNINANSNILSSQFVQSFKKAIGKSSKDKAYKLSADYPFRMNAVKVVLSIAQSLYTQNYVDTSQYTFDYLTSCYEEQGIAFYLIAPIHLSDSSDNGIFGASGENTIYTISAPKGKDSSGEYTYENSLETNLVLKTNGVMYDIQFVAGATDNTMKSFLRSLTETIVDNSVKVSSTEKNCYSSLYNGVMPYTKCTMIVTE